MPICIHGYTVPKPGSEKCLDPKKLCFELETGCFEAQFFLAGHFMSNVMHKNTTIILLGPSRKSYSTAKQLNLNDAGQK
jgi:hypothetical protein